VALVDGNGNTGPFSMPRLFGIQHPLPQPVGATRRASAKTIPTLAWTPVDGAAYYQVEISEDPAFSRVIRATTDNARYTPTQALTADAYYWRVQMFDADRNPGPIAKGVFSLGSTVYLPAVARP
jgi:hypothetical protein